MINTKRFETQPERIARLGESTLWYGQSDFWVPLRTPALEYVTAPATWTGVCARCGLPIEAPAATPYAQSVVVEHCKMGDYRVYHKHCAPRIEAISEQWHGLDAGPDHLTSRLPGF
jgi:hypothetical protein